MSAISYNLEQELKRIDGLKIRENVSAAELTTFKGGGSVRFYLIPENLTALTLALRALEIEGVKPLILGKGANTVIDDGGISTPVLSLVNFSEISQDKNFVTAGCGCSSNRLLHYTRQNALTGLEFLAGIPATVGGLIAMNAGAFGIEIKDKAVECEILNCGFVKKALPKFSYRKAEFNGILLSATFNLDFSTTEEVGAEIERNLETRRKKQPNLPSCGSVFKAHDGIPAAVFIEQTGLKGTKIGGAEISRQHCNFIVNTGGATASDFLKLAELISSSVYYEFGAELEPEYVLLNENKEDF